MANTLEDEDIVRLFALINEVSKITNRSAEYLHGWVAGRYRVASLKDLTVDQCQQVMSAFEKKIEKVLFND